ncbi:MAG: 2-C-methyl-D-erythritol 4-phosphate cytidylyltransferase [Desulfuromonadaceae bacterium]|nr:2-C-methyl-D-erythritol 4-phosphate cytidylyltransferase [Desulfuromonadaceae bacterium]
MIINAPVKRRDISALVPAAGEGMRLGLGPKAWLTFDDRPLLFWVTQKLASLAEEIVVAVSPDDVVIAEKLLSEFGDSVRVLAGGASRQETVARLVDAAQKPIVLIQDVARPFATNKLISTVCAEAFNCGGAAAFLPPEVPVAKIQGGWVTEYFSAGEVGIFQAPQAFERTRLQKIMLQASASSITKQSTAQLWLDAGCPLRVVPGEKTNIKLTTPEDWIMAQSLKEYLNK